MRKPAAFSRVNPLAQTRDVRICESYAEAVGALKVWAAKNGRPVRERRVGATHNALVIYDVRYRDAHGRPCLATALSEVAE